MGNVLKLGRIEYLVLFINNNQYESSEQAEGNLVDCLDMYAQSEDSLNGFPTEVEKKTCKICLAEDETPDNLFISPCKCNGSC